MDLVYELFSSLPRGAPGSRGTTLQALSRLDGLPRGALVLDVGCGTGPQSRALASAGLEPIAADVSPMVLDILRQRAVWQGISSMVRPVAADMARLPFRSVTFDLLWCEAAVYNLGFAEGVESLAVYLKSGGLMAVSEIVWLTREPSPGNRDFWAAEYPAMLDFDEARKAVGRAGLELLDDFLLPESDWEENFYTHLERALPDLLARHPGDEQAAELAEMCRKEISMHRRYGHEYGMAFFLMRKV
jgi:SAM-dependent methyltransferase